MFHVETYLLPLFADLLAYLSGGQIITSLNMFRAYLQISMEDESKNIL